MFAGKFLAREKFDSYDDYIQNGAVHVPENFNFAYDVIDAVAAETPDKPALLWVNDSGERRQFSFGDISRMSNAAANYLMSVGLVRGDTVLLFLRRRWEYWILMMAMHKVGIIPIPSTNQLKSEDIKYRIDTAAVRAIIAFDDGVVVNEIQNAMGADADKIRLILTPEIDAALDTFPQTLARIPNQNSDTMVVYFTSGTTDMPKMVAHNYTYPLGHINTAVFWQQLTDDDIHFTLSESGWAKCSWGKMYGQWIAGATVFVFDFSRVFTAHDLLTAISENGVTSFCAPPTAYKMLIHADMSRYDLSCLRKAEIAGEALNPEVYERFLQRTGIKMREGFGQTETCVMLFNNPWIEPKPGSMGMPAAGWDIKLLDERGREVADGTVGEICVDVEKSRPVGLFQGYHKNEKLTAATVRDGYYHTGDVAYRDADGYYWFVGRNDDLIKTSGYRVSPFEVESVLMEHPAVREVAVTGVPDASRGMAVKATIVLNKYFQPNDVLKGQLQHHVKSRTAVYKCPRVIEFVDSLPMTISGKIRRALIRTLDTAKANIIDPVKEQLGLGEDKEK